MNPQQYVKYLPEFQSVICVACKSCITSDSAKRHFMEHHNSVELKLRQSILRYIDSLSLVSITAIRIPSESISAILELPIHDGWRCRYIADCHYVCAKESTMQKHYLRKHNAGSLQNLRGILSLLCYN